MVSPASILMMVIRPERFGLEADAPMSRSLAAFASSWPLGDMFQVASGTFASYLKNCLPNRSPLNFWLTHSSTTPSLEIVHLIAYLYARWRG